jgi:mono/diheme cytochrome c family protein
MTRFPTRILTAPRRTQLIGVALGLAALLAGALVLSPVAPAQTDLQARGRYLTTIMDCGGCHTPGALAGNPDGQRLLAGSNIGFELPGLGVVYPRNLTPDPETGLGRWTDAEILRALRQGQGRDGRALAPIMPWPAYGILTDDDARAIVAFLRSVPPVRFEVPPYAKTGEKPTAPYLTVVQPR